MAGLHFCHKLIMSANDQKFWAANVPNLSKIFMLVGKTVLGMAPSKGGMPPMPQIDIYFAAGVVCVSIEI